MSTPTLILHHYTTSPFSEKVRLILGAKQLAWKSVSVPAIMPKPDVLALTGGYRKTPFMQIGSDIYCDTALICDVLEQLQPEHTLYPKGTKGLARITAQWADRTLFWAAMAYNLSPKGVAQLFAGVSREMTQAFGEDRRKMSAGMTRLRPGDATAAYKSYLRLLAEMLEHNEFLLGSTPTVADFATYHPLWFTRKQVPVMAWILDATPGVLDWMERMAAIGHGQMEPISATEAIAVCAQSAGAAALNDATSLDGHKVSLGQLVTVGAESFGSETTSGELVEATPDRYTLRRTDERAGVVHVHFPRVGYVLKKAPD